MTKKKIISSQLSTFVFVLLIKLCLPLLLTSCGAKEKQGKDLEKKDNVKINNPKKPDTLKYYYPVSLADENNNSTSCDTSMLSTFSGSLLEAREPVIYSFNDQFDVYRLLIFKASGPVMIISLNKDNGKVWLRAKELSRPAFLKPQKGGNFVPALNDDGSIDSLKDVSYEEYETIAELSGKLELKPHISHVFSKDIWDKMENLVHEADFWKMAAYMNMDHRGNDHWILEARVKNKYWLVDKVNPGGELRKCCDYLVELKSQAEK